jgi:protein pelota
MLGIQEALKKGAAIKSLEDAKLAQEAQLMEQLLAEIAKDGLCSYGREQIIASLNEGSVETLMILDELVREEEGRKILSHATSMNAKIVLVSQHHDAGDRLRALGGVAALLRYKSS